MNMHDDSKAEENRLPTQRSAGLFRKNDSVIGIIGKHAGREDRRQPEAESEEQESGRDPDRQRSARRRAGQRRAALARELRVAGRDHL